ncbi:MAG: hypothetical protein V7767_09535 [Leeuwenhoekiella sp.]
MTILESSFSNQISDETVLKFGKLYYIGNSVIIEINKGYLIDNREKEQIMEDIVTKIPSSLSFYIISNRINTYTVAPGKFHTNKKIESRILGFYFVTYDSLALRTAQFESKFLSVKTMQFSAIDHALLAANRKIVSKL